MSHIKRLEKLHFLNFYLWCLFKLSQKNSRKIAKISKCIRSFQKRNFCQFLIWAVFQTITGTYRSNFWKIIFFVRLLLPLLPDPPFPLSPLKSEKKIVRNIWFMGVWLSQFQNCWNFCSSMSVAWEIIKTLPKKGLRATLASFR